MKQFNKISSLELSEILHKHELWLAKEKDGVCANLSFRDLRGVDLSHKNLTAANLSHSRFEGADFSHIKGTFLTAIATDFSNAKMTSCDFTNANFEDANLSFCDLSYSIFNSSNIIRGADLTVSNIAFANLMKTNIHISQIRSVALDKTEEDAFL